MRIPVFMVAALAFATPLAACAGSGQFALAPLTLSRQTAARGLPARPRTFLAEADTLTPLVYISDAQNNVINAFDRSGVLLETIPSDSGGLSEPLGIFVDARHNLWVANGGDADVLEFKRGATTPSATLDDPGNTPFDVTICPNGTTYVSNHLAVPFGPGSISVYAPGSTQPTGLLQFPGEDENLFLTCDRAGNVFTTTALTFPRAYSVIEYPGGHQSGAVQLPIPHSALGGIKMDNAGNLLVYHDRLEEVIEYTEAGIRTGNKIHTGGEWGDIAVARDGRVVLGADEFLNGATSKTFPAGAFRKNYVLRAIGSPAGVAFDPGE